MQDRPSPNHDTRPDDGMIDMLVIHYTGMRTANEAIDRLCDPASKVSAHYLIDENGVLYRLVPEERRAWHAGLSFWRGHEDVNARSIGIELVNPGHEFGYRAFPSEQMNNLIEMAKSVLARHPVPPWNVVGHSDVAPLRKSDPGELFDWKTLAGHNIGFFPPVADERPEPSADIAADLTRIGYDSRDTERTSASLRAFRMHFLPGATGGDEPDPATLSRLKEVADAVGH